MNIFGDDLRRGLAFIVLFIHLVCGDVSYSIPEEMKGGSVVGNIAKDLGLDLGTLSVRKARIETEDNGVKYCSLNVKTGDLIVGERMDREGLCEKRASCVVKQEVVLENPLELHRINIHIQDINDNSPQFKEESIKLEIRESAMRGSTFLLDEAHDADIGDNAVRGYSLQANDYFKLNVKSKGIGRKYGELVLDKELDREDKNTITFLLTAFDGGSSQKSGTVVIHVTVLDANDNAPVFSQIVYEASLPENSSMDSVVLTVSATDPDEGVNGEITYGFDHVSDEISASDSMKQNLIVAVKDNGQPSLSATCSMFLLISDNLAEVPELKDISHDENNSKLTSYLIIALVSVSTFFLTFIIIILGVRFCRRRKPRLLFDGAVAIPGAYLPPNYSDVNGTGTLRSTYNYDAYLTTGSRTSDFKFLSSYNDNTLPADQTLKKSPTEFADVFGDNKDFPEVKKKYMFRFSSLISSCYRLTGFPDFSK
ncbi:PREDICTED: protocadherin gamma-A4-like [Poecilia mexicana]|uniref:protocadherin gamma-A4-like n=1 Tax=Poecilia mexicana TaxID=48701 RepID=UPI00072E832E|nr:PREDICTED: protocadherin gamma-A4-like [Poecilia mexicana]